MRAHALRLVRDALQPSARLVLAGAHRVLYVLDGGVHVRARGPAVPLGADAAWHGADPVTVEAGAAGATLLRYELNGGAGAGAEAGVTSGVLLEHAIDLDPAVAYLMRCDRVDFDPGGVALPHRHRGGGIRCLVAGALEVTVGAAPPSAVRPGEAWFESGQEPVLARASLTEPTSFIRVSILPREIRGRSSILYVDPADAARGTPRRYTVYIDEPIEV